MKPLPSSHALTVLVAQTPEPTLDPAPGSPGDAPRLMAKDSMIIHTSPKNSRMKRLLRLKPRVEWCYEHITKDGVELQTYPQALSDLLEDARASGSAAVRLCVEGVLHRQDRTVVEMDLVNMVELGPDGAVGIVRLADDEAPVIINAPVPLVLDNTSGHGRRRSCLRDATDPRPRIARKRSVNCGAAGNTLTEVHLYEIVREITEDEFDW